MEHGELVAMIQNGVVPGTWADLGSGAGAFTMALADLLGPGCRIVSVDRDARALDTQRRSMTDRFPGTLVDYRVADFSRRLDLPVPALDGILMANSLHFQRRKESVLGMVRDALRPGGRLLLVEYDTDRGNPWVPHPLSYPTWEGLARETGFTGTRLLARRPSRHLNAMYAALSLRPDVPATGPRTASRSSGPP